MASSKAIHTVPLPRARLRRFARRLVELGQRKLHIKQEEDPIRVVCISDTHNHQPKLPDGDLLLHAGDMTEWGSFDEIQKQLTWLSSQPHEHKVVIPGNHDILFDPDFLEAESDRFPIIDGKTADKLDFGSVIYLQDESKTITFSKTGRQLSIYGSPRTPQYVSSAFQYSRDDDVWSEKIPKNTDILLTHGPPYGHLDGWRHAGCQYLARAVEQVRPRIVVFGHIHVGHGREVVKLDWLKQQQEDIERGCSGWETIPMMILALTWTTLRQWFVPNRTDRVTEFINAAVVGESNKLCNEATVTTI